MTERTRTALPAAPLDQLFRQARTHNAFEPQAIPQVLLHEMYELAKWGPTASNGNPARFVFLVSAACSPHVGQQPADDAGGSGQCDHGL